MPTHISPQKRVFSALQLPVHVLDCDERHESRRSNALAETLRRSSARAFGERIFAAAHFEAVSTVDRLDVEDLAARETEHSLDRGRHVLVHPVGELNHHDGTLARCPHEPSCDGAGTLAKLAQDDFHVPNLASPTGPSSSVAEMASVRCADPSQVAPLPTGEFSCEGGKRCCNGR